MGDDPKYFSDVAEQNQGNCRRSAGWKCQFPMDDSTRGVMHGAWENGCGILQGGEARSEPGLPHSEARAGPYPLEFDPRFPGPLLIHHISGIHFF